MIYHLQLLPIYSGPNIQLLGEAFIALKQFPCRQNRGKMLLARTKQL